MKKIITVLKRHNTRSFLSYLLALFAVIIMFFILINKLWSGDSIINEIFNLLTEDINLNYRIILIRGFYRGYVVGIAIFISFSFLFEYALDCLFEFIKRAAFKNKDQGLELK